MAKSNETEELLVLSKHTLRTIASWKHRIYKKHGTIKEFIDPLGIKKSRFSLWLHGHNIPPAHIFQEIEERLRELGV